jgi:hypothetical protein
VTAQGDNLFRLEVSGAAQVASLFLSLPAAIQRRVLTGFIRDSSKDILNAIVPKAPNKTGKLRKALKSRAQSARTRKRFRVDIGYSVRRVGTGGRALHLIELGTKDRYTKGASRKTGPKLPHALRLGAGKRGYRGKMPAKPFMRAAAAPAMARVKSEIQTRLTAQLQRLLDQASKRNAWRSFWAP